MLRKNKDNNNVDYNSLNSILRTGKNIMNIGYFMAIVALVLLATFIIKEWSLLKFIKEFLIVISPIFIGFIIAWLFEPVVSSLQKNKVPRVAGCIIVYVILIGMLSLFGYLFVPSLISQVKDFVAIAPSIFNELTDFCMRVIRMFDANKLVDTVTLKASIMGLVSDYGMSIASSLPKYLLSIGRAIFNGGLNFILGLMIGFYLLFDFDKVGNTIRNILPTTWRDNYDELIERVNTSLRNYVQGVLIIMLLVFLTQSIGLTIAGLEAPIVFALFCAVTDIIPYFGPYIGGIPAVIVGFTISPITGVCVLISILIVQALENNFYQPLIMGHTMKLHPVTIMAGLLLFEHFFGILGMVLATPVIATLKIFITFFNEKFNFLDRFTGGEE